MKIVLYGKQGDAYSVAFRNFLKSTNEDFIYIDISKDVKARNHTKELYDGMLKYPTLFVDDRVFLIPTTEEFNKIMQDLNLRA